MIRGVSKVSAPESKVFSLASEVTSHASEVLSPASEVTSHASEVFRFDTKDPIDVTLEENHSLAMPLIAISKISIVTVL